MYSELHAVKKGCFFFFLLFLNDSLMSQSNFKENHKVNTSGSIAVTREKHALQGVKDAWDYRNVG